MRSILPLVLVGLAGTSAFAQSSAVTTTTGQPTTSSFEPPISGSPVKRLLIEGYEIKTGFSDNNGGAYMLLQKATSAYMCHSNPTQTCEKLN